MLLKIYKRLLLVSLALPLFLTSITATTKVNAAGFDIVILKSQSSAPFSKAQEGFKQCLIKNGIQANFHVVSFEGNTSKGTDVIAAAKKHNPHLIVTLGSLATKTASEKVTDIPIVAGMILSAEKLIQSENVTALLLEYPIAIQLTWLKRFLPKAKTIGIIYNSEENQGKIDEAHALAQQMGLRLIAEKVSSPKKIPFALENLSKKADILWGIPDKIVYTPQTAKQFLLFSFRNRIPFIGLSSAWVKAGALYALDWDYNEVGRNCGDMAVKILQGSKTNGVHTATEKGINYSVNLKAAERMKIEIPAELLKEAKNVY